MDSTYTYAQLDENGQIVYFIPYCGGLRVKEVRRGKNYTVLYLNPTEAQMNAAGWYRVVNIDEVGTDYIAGNILYHYTGTIIVEDDDEMVEEETNETEADE